MRESVTERVRNAVGDWIGGRRVVLAGVPIAATPGWIGQLRSLGAGRILVLGTTLGTGAPPDPDHAEWLDLDIRASDPVDEFRKFEHLAADPSTEMVVAIDRFDPHGDALVLTAPFQAVTAIAGRPVAGGRRAEWVALEDKTTNDALFDRAGVDRPPSEIVAADDRSALGAAAARLDRGHGTVWSGDAQEGFNGAGTFVRWVTDERRADAAQRRFAARCRRVRVAPLLEGTTLQHPRLRHRRGVGGVPAGGGDNAAVGGPTPPALRGSGHVLRPTRGRPGEDADRRAPGAIELGYWATSTTRGKATPRPPRARSPTRRGR